MSPHAQLVMYCMPYKILDHFSEIAFFSLENIVFATPSIYTNVVVSD